MHAWTCMQVNNADVQFTIIRLYYSYYLHTVGIVHINVTSSRGLSHMISDGHF